MRRFEDEAGDLPKRSEPTSPWVVEARQAFQRTLQLDPQFVRAYTELAKTYIFDGVSQQPGIDLARKVLERVPNPSLAMALMTLHAAAGDRETSHRVYGDQVVPLLASSGERDQAKALGLDGSDLMVARAWRRQGRTEEALRLAREVADRTEVEAIRKDALEFVEELGGGETAEAPEAPASSPATPS